MIDIGAKMWELFTRYNYFRPACEIIKPKYSNDIGQVELAQSSDHDHWISAIHSVYDGNKDDVKQSLESLVDRLSPDVCFVSTHYSKESLLSEVWPFASTNNKNVDPQFNGTLTEITRWRRDLNSTLSQSHGYLNSSVTWKWPDAEIWYFFSRGGITDRRI